MFRTFLRGTYFNVLTKDTNLNRNYSFYIDRIEFDSICLKQRFFPPIRKPAIAYCQCLISDQNNADLANHRSLDLFFVFSVALLFLCLGTWLIELVEKPGLRPSLYFLGATAGVRSWYDRCYRRTV